MTHGQIWRASEALAARAQGDRIVVRTNAGCVMAAKTLGQRNNPCVERIALNPAYSALTLKAPDKDWIARYLWASQCGL